MRPNMWSQRMTIPGGDGSGCTRATAKISSVARGTSAVSDTVWTGLLLVLVLLATGCASKPTRADAQAQISSTRPRPRPVVSPEPEFRVTLGFAADGSVRVKLNLPLSWYREDLDWVDLEHFKVEFDDGRGIERFLRTEAGGPWIPRFPNPGGDLEVVYTLVPGAHEAHPKTGVDEVPHPVRGGYYHNGRSLFPTAVRTPGGKSLDAPTTIQLSAPTGMTLVSSLKPSAENLTEVRASSLAEAANAVYYLGNFRKELLSVGQSKVYIVSSDFDATELEPYVRLAKRMLSMGREVLGPATVEELLLTIDRHPGGGVDGGVTGRGISVLIPDTPDDRALPLPGTVLVHELSHLWNRADAMWLGEGYTRYLDVVFRTRLDGVNEAAALEEFLRLHSGYLASAPGPLRNASGADAYRGGAMLSLCLDASLRADGHSLFEAHRVLREQAPAGQTMLRADEFRSVVQTLSPVTAAMLDRLLDQPKIDVVPCFRAAGYAVTVTEYSGFSARALALDVLKVGSYTGATVATVREGSTFRPGDVVLRSRGKAVRSISELEPLLARAKPGSKMPISVRRAGAETTIRVTIPKLAAADRPSKRLVTVVAPSGIHFLTERRSTPAPG